MVGLGAAPAVFQFGFLLFLPETPRWLMKAGELKLAEQTLERVYKYVAAELLLPSLALWAARKSQWSCLCSQHLSLS